MLAQNFLPAAELGLSDLERDSLITVLGQMERGELEHEDNWMKPTRPNGFNMAPYVRSTECGTVACIAGWAYLASGKKAFDPDDTIKLLLQLKPEKSIALTDLFTARLRDDTTPAQAAMALRNYLTTGTPDWEAVFVGEDLIPLMECDAPSSGLSAATVVFDDVKEYA